MIIIRELEDLNKLIWLPLPEIRELVKRLGFTVPYGMEIIDFEGMKGNGIDAIWLTEAGQWETRHTYPRNLYGWDCETIFIMNESCVKSTKVIQNQNQP
jgi:hypothetical protein